MEDGSTPLKNSRHERFACELAKGKSQDEAYQIAGFEANPSNASRLNRNEQVVNRVLWIKKQSAGEDVLTLSEKRKIAAQIARGGEKDSDRLSAIKVDNDLAVHGAEAGANKALEIIIRRL